MEADLSASHSLRVIIDILRSCFQQVFDFKCILGSFCHLGTVYSILHSVLWYAALLFVCSSCFREVRPDSKYTARQRRPRFWAFSIYMCKYNTFRSPDTDRCYRSLSLPNHQTFVVLKNVFIWQVNIQKLCASLVITYIIWFSCYSEWIRF